MLIILNKICLSFGLPSFALNILLYTCPWAWTLTMSNQKRSPSFAVYVNCVHFAFQNQHTTFSVAIIFRPAHITINIIFHMCPNKVYGCCKLHGVKSAYFFWSFFLGMTESYLVLNDVTITEMTQPKQMAWIKAMWLWSKLETAQTMNVSFLVFWMKYIWFISVWWRAMRVILLISMHTQSGKNKQKHWQRWTRLT